MADVTRIRPPFRADHVGSLLRPARLHAARADREAGKISAAILRGIEDDCIRDAIAMQESVGLQAITDGELRRKGWQFDFITRIRGFAFGGESQGPTFRIGHAANSVEVTGKIANPDGIMLDDFAFLHAHTSRTAKFCIPSPSLAYHRGGRALIDAGVYPALDAFWEDLCAAYRDEVRMLVDAGCRYLQLDDTTFAMLCDPKVRQSMTDRGDDSDRLIETYARGIAEAIRDRPADLAVTVHMCRGNFRSSWIAEGGYEPVAETMFNNVPVDAFFMEWDSEERAGGFEPLRFVPDDKIVVLGLITSKFPELEPKDQVKRRIDEASKYVPLERFCLSPQCGFASTVEGNRLTEDEQKRKLAHVVEIADEVWGSA